MVLPFPLTVLPEANVLPAAWTAAAAAASLFSASELEEFRDK